MVVVQATSETTFPYSDIIRKTCMSLIMIKFLSDENNKKYNSNLCYKIRKHKVSHILNYSKILKRLDMVSQICNSKTVYISFQLYLLCLFTYIDS